MTTQIIAPACAKQGTAKRQIQAATSAATLKEEDSAFVDFDRRILIRDSICEVLDWSDMLRREQGDDHFERLVPVMLQRIDLLSSCILDAIDDPTTSTESIQQRIDGKAVQS